jgi:hypothetical protein
MLFLIYYSKIFFGILHKCCKDYTKQVSYIFKLLNNKYSAVYFCFSYVWYNGKYYMHQHPVLIEEAEKRDGFQILKWFETVLFGLIS